MFLMQFSAGLEELWSSKVKTIDFMVIGPIESELHHSTGTTQIAIRILFYLGVKSQLQTSQLVSQ